MPANRSQFVSSFESKTSAPVPVHAFLDCPCLVQAMRHESSDGGSLMGLDGMLAKVAEKTSTAAGAPAPAPAQARARRLRGPLSPAPARPFSKACGASSRPRWPARSPACLSPAHPRRRSPPPRLWFDACKGTIKIRRKASLISFLSLSQRQRGLHGRRPGRGDVLRPSRCCPP